jgi:hypothetical protein
MECRFGLDEFLKLFFHGEPFRQARKEKAVTLVML